LVRYQQRGSGVVVNVNWPLAEGVKREMDFGGMN